jgi:hypothetical protein
MKAMDGGSQSTSRRLKKKVRSNKKTFYHWDHNNKEIGKKWEKMRQRERKIGSMLLVPVLIMILLILVAKKVSEWMF